jgi:hypothetical protein
MGVQQGNYSADWPHQDTARGSALTPNLASPFNQAVKIIAGRSFLVYTHRRGRSVFPA